MKRPADTFREQQQVREETAAIGKFAVIVVLASLGIAGIGAYIDSKRSQQAPTENRL